MLDIEKVEKNVKGCLRIGCLSIVGIWGFCFVAVHLHSVPILRTILDGIVLSVGIVGYVLYMLFGNILYGIKIIFEEI